MAGDDFAGGGADAACEAIPVFHAVCAESAGMADAGSFAEDESGVVDA